MKALTTPFAAAALVALFLETGCASSEEETAARPKKPSQAQPQQIQSQTFESETPVATATGAQRTKRPDDVTPPSSPGQRYQTRDLSQVEYAVPTLPAGASTPGSPGSKGPGRSRMMDNYTPSSGAPSNGRSKSQPKGKAGAAAAALSET